jgi:sulfate adenylyltransferase subunit 2
MRSSVEILESLENESIEIIRETAASFRNPVFLYSIGKDSSSDAAYRHHLEISRDDRI